MVGRFNLHVSAHLFHEEQMLRSCGSLLTEGHFKPLDLIKIISTNRYSCAAFLSLGTLLFLSGYDITMPAGLLIDNNFISYFCVNEETCTSSSFQWILFCSHFVAFGFLGAGYGAFIGTYLSSRPRYIAGSLIIYIFSLIVSILIPHSFDKMLIFCRFLSGVALGSLTITIPNYCLEIASKDLRHYFHWIMWISFCSGILIAGIMNVICIYYFPSTNGWRFVLGAPLIPSFLLFLISLKIPESPEWVFLNHGGQSALESLQELRFSPNVSEELGEIEERITASSTHIYTTSFKLPGYYDTILVIFFQILQKCIGVSCLFAFASLLLIWENTNHCLEWMFWFYISYVIGSFLGNCVTEDYNKRAFLIMGTISMFITLLISTLMYSYLHSNRGIVVALFGGIYMFIFGLTWENVLSMYVVAMSPSQRRIIQAITNASNWIAGFAFSYFILFFHTTGFYGVACILGFGCIISCITLMFFYREKH